MTYLWTHLSTIVSEPLVWNLFSFVPKTNCPIFFLGKITQTAQPKKKKLLQKQLSFWAGCCGEKNCTIQIKGFPSYEYFIISQVWIWRCWDLFLFFLPWWKMMGCHRPEMEGQSVSRGSGGRGDSDHETMTGKRLS